LIPLTKLINVVGFGFILPFSFCSFLGLVCSIFISSLIITVSSFDFVSFIIILSLDLWFSVKKLFVLTLILSSLLIDLVLLLSLNNTCLLLSFELNCSTLSFLGLSISSFLTSWKLCLLNISSYSSYVCSDFLLLNEIDLFDFPVFFFFNSFLALICFSILSLTSLYLSSASLLFGSHSITFFRLTNELTKSLTLDCANANLNYALVFLLFNSIAFLAYNIQSLLRLYCNANNAKLL